MKDARSQQGRLVVWVSAIAAGLVLSSVPRAWAGLGDMVKDAAKKVVKKDKDKEGEGGESEDQIVGEKKGDLPGRRAKDAKGFPPGLEFSSLLNSVTIIPEKGELRIGGEPCRAVFIPEDVKEGLVVLRDGEGKEISRFVWKPHLIEKPYYLMDFQAVAQAELKPGDYILDFYTDQEHFYTFKFGVTKGETDDPFAKSFYYIEGPWADWGYLYIPKADPEQNLYWKVWLRQKSDQVNKDANYDVRITRDSDGEVICESRERSDSFRPKWERREFDMIFPKGKGESYGQYFKAKDLLATDGDYTLTMTGEGKPYGTWKFKVVDGKFNYTGQTVRGEADPLTFVEGGRDAWWYKKEAEKEEKKE